MRKTFAILLCLCQPSWATWSIVQHKFTIGSASTCAVTTNSTGSANLLVAVGAFGTAGGSLNSAPTGGCSGTWTHCTTCTSTDSGGFSNDIYYCLNSASGVTSITVNGSTTFDWCEIAEFSTTAASFAFDVGGNRDQSVASTSIAGVTLTLTGSNDAIIQAIETGSTSSISSPYFILDKPNSNGVAASTNTATGAAPTWTTGSGRAALTAIAIKETTAGSSSACESGKLLGVGCF